MGCLYDKWVAGRSNKKQHHQPVHNSYNRNSYLYNLISSTYCIFSFLFYFQVTPSPGVSPSRISSQSVTRAVSPTASTDPSTPPWNPLMASWPNSSQRLAKYSQITMFTLEEMRSTLIAGVYLKKNQLRLIKRVCLMSENFINSFTTLQEIWYIF